MHLRILWRMLDSRGIPSSPSPSAIVTFNQRFQSSRAVELQQASPKLLLAVSQVRGAAAAARSSTSNSKVAKMVCRMEENIISYIDNCLARFGLEEWTPDLDQTPYALYNTTHRIIAIDTFKQAAVAHAYAQLKPNLKYVQNMALLEKIYNHFVHFYFYSRYVQERDSPGSVAALDGAGPAYKGRNRVSFIFNSIIFKHSQGTAFAHSWLRPVSSS